MFRVLPILAISTTIVAGCGFDPPAPIVRTKIVTVTGQTCRIETRQLTSVEFCATEPLECPKIKTCAEAYYRLTVCKQVLLDGGTAQGTYDKPNKHGEPDGIPCENKCGHDAREMVKKIWAEQAAGKQPFTLPMAPPKEKCDPA